MSERPPTLPQGPSSRLCLRLPLPSLPIGRSMALTLDDGRPALLVMQSDGPRAFLDRCPHQGSRMLTEDETGDPYMDATGGLILCHRHQACFEPHHGTCISGPCVGQRLTALDVELVHNDASPAQLLLWEVAGSGGEMREK